MAAGKWLNSEGSPQDSLECFLELSWSHVLELFSPSTGSLLKLNIENPKWWPHPSSRLLCTHPLDHYWWHE